MRFVGMTTACCMTFGLRDTTQQDTAQHDAARTSQQKSTRHSTAQFSRTQQPGTAQHNTTISVQFVDTMTARYLRT